MVCGASLLSPWLSRTPTAPRGCSWRWKRPGVDGWRLYLATTVAAEFRPAVAQHRTKLELQLPDTEVSALCDRERVAQIMRILVDNAIRHTPEGTPVTVSAARRNGTAKITVADWGPGLEGGEASQVFDRFFTGDAENGGAGLGLAIAKELAERMHGEIRLKSRPGRTAFTFEMPSE